MTHNLQYSSMDNEKCLQVVPGNEQGFYEEFLIPLETPTGTASPFETKFNYESFGDVLPVETLQQMETMEASSGEFNPGFNTDGIGNQLPPINFFGGNFPPQCSATPSMFEPPLVSPENSDGTKSPASANSPAISPAISSPQSSSSDSYYGIGFDESPSPSDSAAFSAGPSSSAFPLGPFGEADKSLPDDVMLKMLTECKESNWEAYHEVVMQSLVEEVQKTSHKLAIPVDPNHWTPSEAERWLGYTLALGGQDGVDMSVFNGVSGKTLIGLGPIAFDKLIGEGGSKMRSSLDIWIEVTEYLQMKQKAKMERTVVKTEPESDDDLLADLPRRIDAFLAAHGSIDDMSSDYTFSGFEHKIGFDGRLGSSSVQLWQFLFLLLEDPVGFHDIVRWVDRDNGIFKVENSKRLAQLWGARKNRRQMNYDKLSRSLRQYYRKNILKKTSRAQRLVYQFCPPYPFSVKVDN